MSWTGKVLRVDLSRGSWSIEALDLLLAVDFIGGRGLGARLLLSEVDPQVSPFSPQNKLILATGPLTGTGAPTGSGFCVVTKSPLTGAIACSTSGGYFGPELKFAGYDLIILEGKSPSPVCLSINDDEIQIIPATHLWGETTCRTEDIIRADFGDPWLAREIHIASIGPAGERLVRFASIVNDKYWAAARSGVGAVMGSKNLKAIVLRGTKGILVGSPDNFKQAVSDTLDKIKRSPLASQVLPELGTSFLIEVIQGHGILATRNFQDGVFGGASKISGEAMRNTMPQTRRGCFSCPIGCTKIIDKRAQAPGYDALAQLGACCGIDDLSALTSANLRCNELGIDVISAGGTIACAMELYQRGILSPKDTGLRLDFGEAGTMVELIEDIGMRRGFGEVLGEGAWRLAQTYGHPELFMGVKGQEAPAYDPRGVQGLGLQYATSNTGACYASGYTVIDEILGIHQKMNPQTAENKAAFVKLLQEITAVTDSSGLCPIVLFVLKLADVLAMLEAATGAGYTEENLLLAGERVWNVERLFDLKAGFGSKDDTLPPRMLREPMPSGPARGQVCQLDHMLPEYHQLRGWDENGIPLSEKLAELGLEYK